MEQNTVLSVGFGRADITPTERVPLAGYGNTSRRISTTVLDPLYATCLALTGGETVLLYHVDLAAARDVYKNRLRPAISKATGVDERCIFLTNTHNHSSPDVTNTAHDTVLRYIDFLEARLIAAAKQALEDRKPVTAMATGSIETQGMNFVRRYVLADGTYAGDNYGHF